MQKGTIGVTTENIFPIIKQFLYSDRGLGTKYAQSHTRLKPLRNCNHKAIPNP